MKLAKLLDHFKILDSVLQNSDAGVYSLSNCCILVAAIHLVRGMPVWGKIEDKKYAPVIDSKNVNYRETLPALQLI